MAATPAEDGSVTPADETPPVTALRTSPDRTVFAEDGNADGWISTDHTVATTR